MKTPFFSEPLANSLFHFAGFRLRIGVIAIVLVAASQIISRAAALELSTNVPDNAFPFGVTPEINLRVKGEGARGDVTLTVELADLISDQKTTDTFRLSASAGVYRPKSILNGVHRITFSGTDLVPAAITIAVSPAKIARELPDSWPLATHHYSRGLLSAPMPGFKWYRTFLPWRTMNPERGVYNWAELDLIISQLEAVGGRLLVCMEGAPFWVSRKGTAEADPAHLTHPEKTSHWAPDDWNDLRTFVREFVNRYGESKVVGAVEPWNEPNANLRWKDTYENLVELHKVWFEETRKTHGNLKVVGLSISPGHHVEYVEGLTEAGILQYMDILAGHFYEERGSLNRLNARNNFELHVDLLRGPLLREGRYLPIWDTEGGMGFEVIAAGAGRPGGRIPHQNEVSEALRKRTDFEAERPWATWPNPGERRYAAWAVTFTTAALGADIQKNFTFHPNWYVLDGALNLPWVANGVFGSVLEEVDYRYVVPIAVAEERGVESDDPAVGALAYRIGKPGAKQVLVVWANRISPRSAFPATWANWLAPVKIRIPTKSTEVVVEDMYRRTKKSVKAVDEVITVEAGEEPVFVWGWTFKDI